MDAKKFLRDSNLTHYVDGNTEDKVVYEDDVIYLMEKYHQAKVNNVVLDDVSKSVAKQYAEFCVRCDRKGLPLLELDDYIKQYCC
jgi:hypothetical protein